MHKVLMFTSRRRFNKECVLWQVGYIKMLQMRYLDQINALRGSGIHCMTARTQATNTSVLMHYNANMGSTSFADGGGTFGTKRALVCASLLAPLNTRGSGSASKPNFRSLPTRMQLVLRPVQPWRYCHYQLWHQSDDLVEPQSRESFSSEGGYAVLCGACLGAARIAQKLGTFGLLIM
jgi:hypothetical protein